MLSRCIWIPLLLIGACSSPEGENDGGECTVQQLPYDDALTQRGSVRDVHDPVVIKVGNAHVLFSTGAGIPIRRSADLIEWEPAGRVFTDLPEWVEETIANVEFPWAPDVSFFNERYHLYYSVSTFGSQRSAIGLATSATLEGSWEDHGPVLQSRPGDFYNAIDPNIAFDEDGTPWLAWGSYWGGIRLRRVDPSTGMLSDDDETIHELAFRPVTTAVEAPFIVRRGEYFYLFVSWDQCCQGASSTYKIVVGRSREITGPYVDRSGEDMMTGAGTLVLERYGRIRGPGHNAVHVEDDRYYLVHHFYDAGNEGVPTLQVRALLWDAEGWPLPGPPYESMGDFAGGTPDVTGEWAHSVGFGPPFGVELLPGGDIRLCNAEGTWSLDGDRLTLRWLLDSGEERVEQLVVASNGSAYAGRTEVGTIIRGSRPVTSKAAVSSTSR